MLVTIVKKSISGDPKPHFTPSGYKLGTLGRITKTKLSKYVDLRQFKWDLEKKLRTKRSLMLK